MSRFPRPDYASLDLYAPDRRPVALDLADNTNRWGPHPGAVAAVRAADEDTYTRYPYLYANDLRAAIQRRYGVPAECITTGCGSDDVLDSAFRAAAPEGGVVTFPGPSFSMVEPFSQMNGRRAVEIPWSRALADPETLLEGDPVLVYVCRPNNPTGESAPLGWIAALLAAVARRGGPLVVLDEAYADFAPESLLAEAPSIPHLLVTKTLSKAFGLAGFRVGFAVGTPEVAREVEKSRGPYKVSRIAEKAAVAALDDAEGWVTRTIGEALANRAKLFEALEQRGLRPIPSCANFLLFPVPDGSAKAWNDALRAQGVAVRPFPACPDVGDAMRVTVAPWPMMERFLGALDAILAEGKVAIPDGVAGEGTVKVALLDYGAGNLHSLGKALERGGATVEPTSDWDVALAADALVLPGVGAFSSAVEALPRDRARVRDALESGMPCLGICLGMQLFFEGSDEGEGEGIGLIRGRVRKLDAPVVPHMGWNDVHGAADPLFEGLGGGLAGYYAHSYRCDPVDQAVVIGWTEYSGERLAAAVRYKNAWGVQFHPEKSSRAGLKLLANFLKEAKP